MANDFRKINRILTVELFKWRHLMRTKLYFSISNCDKYLLNEYYMFLIEHRPFLLFMQSERQKG